MTAAQEVSTATLEARIASASERMEEAIAVLGGLEQFEEEDDAAVIETMIRLGRVAVEKIREAQRELEGEVANV